MKKIIAYLLAFFLLAGGSPVTAEAAPPTRVPEPISRVVNGLTVQVDPRMELLSIIEYMGTENIYIQGGLLSRFYTDYRHDIDSYFRKYDKHAAVLYFDKLSEESAKAGLGFDGPQQFMFFLNDDFTVNLDAYETYTETAGQLYFARSETLQVFFEHLRQFCIDTRFPQFFAAHRRYYETIINNTAAILPEENLIGYMKDFFKNPAGSYTVNLVTLYHTGGFAAEAEIDGKKHIYSSIGPDTSKEHIPSFWDTEYFTELEAHEFGHSFIPVASEKNSPVAKEIKYTEYLYEPIREKMTALAYGDWDTALEETILRACVVHIMENYDPEQAKALLKEERNNGFLYIDSIYSSINRYLQYPHDYENFEAFLPTLMRNLIDNFPPAG